MVIIFFKKFNDNKIITIIIIILHNPNLSGFGCNIRPKSLGSGCNTTLKSLGYGSSYKVVSLKHDN